MYGTIHTALGRIFTESTRPYSSNDDVKNARAENLNVIAKQLQRQLQNII
jgi:hypothetical protein